MHDALKTKMTPLDVHIVVDAVDNRMKVFNYLGDVVQRQGKDCIFNALCEGQHDNWKRQSGDTPPGLYKCGVIYYQDPQRDKGIINAYGRYCIDLIDLEGQETNYGRSGISIHGGGSALTYPLAPWQTLTATLGCIRVHNKDLEDDIVPLVKEVQQRGGTVYVSVVR